LPAATLLAHLNGDDPMQMMRDVQQAMADAEDYAKDSEKWADASDAAFKEGDAQSWA